MFCADAKLASSRAPWTVLVNEGGGAEDRLLEHRNSRSRFLTVREKHRLEIQAAEMFRQVQAGSRSAGGCSIERLTYRRSIERRVSALYICKPKHRLIICLFSNAPFENKRN